MDVDGRRLRRIGDEKNRAEPDATLQVHIGVSQVGPKVDAIGRLDLVEVNAARGRRAGEAGNGRRGRLHAHHALGVTGNRGRRQGLAERASHG